MKSIEAQWESEEIVPQHWEVIGSDHLKKEVEGKTGRTASPCFLLFVLCSNF